MRRVGFIVCLVVLLPWLILGHAQLETVLSCAYRLRSEASASRSCLPDGSVTRTVYDKFGRARGDAGGPGRKEQGGRMATAAVAETEWGQRAQGDRDQWAVAARLRAERAVTVKWSAGRLPMGSPRYLNQLWYRQRPAHGDGE